MQDIPEKNNQESGDVRCGMVAVIGRANVGKSTLVNALLKEKISIVSSVAQTTRNLIRGVHTEERGQLVFLDTPGVHKAERDLGKLMNRMARASIEGADVALLLFDSSSEPRLEDKGWMSRLHKESDLDVVILLNKQDRGGEFNAAYREMWDVVSAERESKKDATWMEVSATKGAGLQDILTLLFDLVPMGPMLFPEEMLSDFPRKLAIADVVREKLFEELHDELPHAIAVFIDEIQEKDPRWIVKGTVYVQRHSQKGIVIGNKGRLLKKVCSRSGGDIAEILDHHVTVKLWVKVEENWDRNFWLLKKFGYR